MTEHTCEYSGVTFPTKDGWISIYDRLPKDSKEYLTYCKYGHIKINYFLPSLELFNRDHVTHWMPLPEPPK